MRILIICGRNIGDTVIASNYINEFITKFPEISWYVWTRPECKCFFNDNENLFLITNEFPMGTVKRINFISLFKLIKNLVFLLFTKFDYSIDFIGDIREFLLCKLTLSKTHLSIGWDSQHNFGKLIRPGFFRKFLIEIPISIPNVYDAYRIYSNEISSLLSNHTRQSTLIKLEKSNKISDFSSIKIAIHPFASQKCREWSWDNWNKLISHLISCNYGIFVIAPPNFERQLTDNLTIDLNKVNLICTTVDILKTSLDEFDLLIGLDSFSIHLAEYVGIKSIMLAGANDPNVWVPPSSTYISFEGACPCHPCFNRPTCLGKETEYLCMKNIKVTSVVKLVTNKLLNFERS